MFYLTIVNKILRHCHFWLARQYKQRYLPFYFQGYRILSILLPGIWDTVFNISVTFWDISWFGKNNYRDICQFIRDTCLFTSRDMGYLVPPIQASLRPNPVIIFKSSKTNTCYMYVIKVLHTVVSLPLNHSWRVVVSYKRKYVHDYWLTACSSLPRKKVWLGELTVPQWP